MRNSNELDFLLENAVAAALGLAKPHPHQPSRLRASQRHPLGRRHHHVIAAPRHERSKAA